jgi:hypothetical protein
MTAHGKLRIMANNKLEIPYHVMAISELAKNYSAAAFQLEIAECREVIAKLAAEDNSSREQRTLPHTALSRLAVGAVR